MRSVRIYEDGWYCHRIDNEDVVDWYRSGTTISVDDIGDRLFPIPSSRHVYGSISKNEHRHKYPYSIKPLLAARIKLLNIGEQRRRLKPNWRNQAKLPYS